MLDLEVEFLGRPVQSDVLACARRAQRPKAAESITASAAVADRNGAAGLVQPGRGLRQAAAAHNAAILLDEPVLERALVDRIGGRIADRVHDGHGALVPGHRREHHLERFTIGLVISIPAADPAFDAAMTLTNEPFGTGCVLPVSSR